MQRPLDVDTLWQLERVGAVSLSPDGTRLVCALTRPSMADNRLSTQLWLLPVTSGTPRRLTTAGDRDAMPAFSPDGRHIAFTAQRDQKGHHDASAQLYLIPADGGEARRVSQFAPGIGAFRWMPDSRHVTFVAWVWPELRGSTAQDRRHRQWDARLETGLATAEVQYRHWNTNLPPGRVAHLHRLDTVTGRVTDLFEGTPHELPREDPGLNCFDVSPDGLRVVFSHDPAAVKAGGQRCDLVELTLRGRRFAQAAHHPHWDFTAPRYSPDGTRLAALATPVVRQDTVFGHASFARLSIWPRARAFEPGDARAWELDPQGPLQWEADGGALWCTAESRGRCQAWRHEVATSMWTRSTEAGWVQGLAVTGAAQATTLVTVRDSLAHPARIYAQRDGREWRLDAFNDARLADVTLGRIEEHQVRGALGQEVQLWVVHPPGASRRRSQAALHVIHGGPYTAAGDTFSYRWNPHVLAAMGAVVVQTNYHGSSGFGEAFRTSILGRQGELELADLRAATDWILRQPWADPSRIHAAGASYGGFLVAWMNAHWRPWPQGPIRSYVCHAGVFDRRATWSADSYTQRHRDLGATYWDDPARVAAQSPAEYAGGMDTPTLVIHGAMDFRVPDHNGLAYYNTLKARGVDARLLWFPDEGHWVLKPQNARQWHAEFAAWLRRQGQTQRRQRHRASP